MIGKKVKIFLFVFSFFSLNVCAQNNIFSLFKSDLRKADRLYKNFSYTPALELYKKILDEKEETDHIDLQIARCYKSLNRLGEAEKWYAKVIHNSSEIKPTDRRDYAEALLSNGKYLEAKEWYKEYLKDNPADSNVFYKMESLSSLSVFYEDSLSYTLQTLSINSHESDFSPSYYDHGIVFLSARNEIELIKKIDATTNGSFLDIYFSSFVGKDSLAAPEKFKNKIDTRFHEGPLSFFDNDTKVVFTQNASHMGKGIKNINSVNRLELCYAEKDTAENHWKNIKPLPFNNSSYSTAHPSFCERTNTLYFVSDKPGGYGGTDIYESKFIKGKWSAPQNLGPQINTEENEMFPFIFKGTVLCFASNGHPGIGGLDLFYALVLDSGFSSPKNIGYPINSEADDFALILSANGNTGFFSSNRKNSRGADDIYSFRINNVPMSGLVADKLGETALSEVSLKLIEKGTEKEILITEENGVFYFNLKPGRDYTIDAFKEGYKEKKIFFSTKNDSIDKLPNRIYLERRSKAYVKGTIKNPSGELVKNCQVKIFSRASKEQVLTADDNGEFRCEVDADAENLFVAQKDGMAGLERLKVERMKKGSVVLHLEIELEPFRTCDVIGVLKEEKTLKRLVGYDVSIKNNITKEETFLCTDHVGKFNFTAFSYSTYDIVILFGKKRTNLKGFAPKQDHTFEIFWAEKN